MEAQPPFEFVTSESLREDVPLCYHANMTHFGSQRWRGIILNPRAIMRMGVETAEVP